MSKRLLITVGLLAALVGIYCVRQVDCPYCHNSNSNVKGACVHRERWGYCNEDHNVHHWNKATCDWCRETGKMRGYEALLD